MTIKEAYRKGIQILKDAGIENPAAEVGALLCFAAKCDRSFLYAYADRILDEDLLRCYFSLLEKRARGYPMQYLTGVQEFMSLTFEVGSGVFIPRQETELLVETVIEFCKGQICSDGKARCKILDIGTGSGCIAVSLAYYLQGSFITAVDIMSEAIAIAKKNAHKNGVADRICFVEGNLFENIVNEKFDVIASNPPYIRSGDISGLSREVRDFEPIAALDGGIDGLHYYREIIRESPLYLKDGGMLAFETGYDQAAGVAAIMSGCFSGIKIYKDLAGIDRVVAGRFTLFQEVTS